MKRVAIIGDTQHGGYGHGLDKSFFEVPGTQTVAHAYVEKPWRQPRRKSTVCLRHAKMRISCLLSRSRGAGIDRSKNILSPSLKTAGSASRGMRAYYQYDCGFAEEYQSFADDGRHSSYEVGSLHRSTAEPRAPAAIAAIAGHAMPGFHRDALGGSALVSPLELGRRVLSACLDPNGSVDNSAAVAAHW